MNKQEFEALSAIDRAPAVTLPHALTNKSPRTLLYGYTSDRSTWHVYLDEAGVMHKVVYDHNKLMRFHISGEIPDIELAPDKRLYPEACDTEACKLLIKAGCSLPFTTFTDTVRPANPYIGLPAQALTAATAIVPHLVSALKSADATELAVLAESDKAFLGALAQADLAKLKSAVHDATGSESNRDHDRVLVGVLLSIAAKETGLLMSSDSAFSGPYDVPGCLYIPKGTEARLADKVCELAKDVSNYPLNLVHHSRDTQLDTAKDLLFKRMGWSEYQVPDAEVTDAIVSGRVLLVRVKGNLPPSLLGKGATVRSVRSKSGEAVYLVPNENDQVDRMFFYQGEEVLIGFSMFGPRLRLTEDMLLSRGTMAVLAA